MGQPWGVSGPQFLAIYASGFLLCTIAVLLARRMVQQQASSDPYPGPPLDAYEAAYLAGGRGRVVDAAVYALIRSESLRISSTGQLTLIRTSAAGSIEQAILHHVAANTTPPTLSRLRLARRADPDIQQIATRLTEHGLLVSVRQRRQIRMTALVYVPLAVLGLLRLHEGLSNNRPVGLLELFLGITLAAAVFCLATAPTHTARGKELLKDLIRTHQVHPGHASSLEGLAVMGVAVFGASAIEDAVLRTAFGPSGSGFSPYPGGPGGYGGGGGAGGGGCGG